jgi:hypothetical protein
MTARSEGASVERSICDLGEKQSAVRLAEEERSNTRAPGGAQIRTTVETRRRAPNLLQD